MGIGVEAQGLNRLESIRKLINEAEFSTIFSTKVLKFCTAQLTAKLKEWLNDGM